MLPYFCIIKVSSFFLCDIPRQPPQKKGEDSVQVASYILPLAQIRNMPRPDFAADFKSDSGTKVFPLIFFFCRLCIFPDDQFSHTVPGDSESIDLLWIISAFTFSILLVMRDFTALKHLLSGTAVIRARWFPAWVPVMLTQSVFIICFFLWLEGG